MGSFPICRYISNSHYHNFEGNPDTDKPEEEQQAGKLALRQREVEGLLCHVCCLGIRIPSLVQWGIYNGHLYWVVIH